MAQDYFWASKPTLCGLTGFVLQNMEENNYTYMGKSDLYTGELSNQKFVGNATFHIKDDELIIIENFFDKNQDPRTGRSCLISVSKNFSILKQKEERGF